MDKNIFKAKSFAFAVRIVNCCKIMASDKKEFVLSKQMVRSGTAIAALHREAERAESKKDFAHKMGVALKECNETIYWLELLHATAYLSTAEFESLNIDAVELRRLCTSIIKSTKASL